jgi:HSP20 family protein
MAKKTPWWRKSKPHDEDDDKYGDIESERPTAEPGKRDPKKNKDYEQRRDDRELDRPRFFRSPFDSEFDRIFSESPFSFKNDLFSDMEQEFGEMHNRMDKIFKQAVEGKLEKPGNGGPFVYGFSMRTGPDGVPHIQEFGNMKPEMMRRFRAMEGLPFKGTGELSDAGSSGELAAATNAQNDGPLSREPLTDIMEKDKNVCITMELPGIEKKDIDLNIEDGELVVSVDSPIRKYYKKLPLPSEVDPKSISASYKNGVLDISVKRLKPKTKKGKKIKID